MPAILNGIPGLVYEPFPLISCNSEIRWHSFCISPSRRFEGGIDVKKLDTDVMVGVVEAAVRILMNDGFTRDEALQLMLSQIAVQVSPEIMHLVLR